MHFPIREHAGSRIGDERVVELFQDLYRSFDAQSHGFRLYKGARELTSWPELFSFVLREKNPIVQRVARAESLAHKRPTVSYDAAHDTLVRWLDERGGACAGCVYQDEQRTGETSMRRVCSVGQLDMFRSSCEQYEGNDANARPAKLLVDLIREAMRKT
jgi:hypothetical protein